MEHVVKGPEGHQHLHIHIVGAVVHEGQDPIDDRGDPDSADGSLYTHEGEMCPMKGGQVEPGSLVQRNCC